MGFTRDRALLVAASPDLSQDVVNSTQLGEELAALWLLVCAFLVFFMQSGFALLEAGTVRSKNVKNILMKNVIDACVAAVAWWAVGSAFAVGDRTGCGNPFIGTQHFFAINLGDDGPIGFAAWVFGYAFSATASTIVSGAVAERTQFRSYVVYTTCISAFIYPVVAYWVWSAAGWLSAYRVVCDTDTPSPLFSGSNGLLDFAGSGTVHMVGGGAALMGAWIAGPRIGRYNHGMVVHFDNANPGQMVLGVLILWLGWYGFNAGSTGCMLGCMTTAATAAVNTTISTAAGALGGMMINVIIGAPGDIGSLLNGILAGAVSITASCAFVEPYAAFVIGIIGGCIYKGIASLMDRFQIDDPLSATPVHLGCGAWGVIAAGLFSVESMVAGHYGYAEGWGLFYGGGGTQFGVQILGVVAIAGWTCGLAGMLFWGLRRIGWFRASKDAELQGLDIISGIGSGEFLSLRCLKSETIE